MAPTFRWSSSALRGTSRARVETPTKSPQTLTGSRHGRSFLAAYSISGWTVPPVGYSISGCGVPPVGYSISGGVVPTPVE